MISRHTALAFLTALLVFGPSHGGLAAPESYFVSDSVADHILARDGRHTAHMAWFKQGTPRVLVVFPGGNSGAMVTFSAATPVRSLELVRLNASPDGKGSQATMELLLGVNQTTIEQVQLGSAVAIQRHLAEEADTYEEEVIGAFEEAAGRLTEAERQGLEEAGLFITQPRDSLAGNWRSATVGDRRVVSLSRSEFLGEQDYRIALALPGDCQALGGQKLTLSCPASQTISLQIQVTSPYSPLTPLATADLLHHRARTHLASPELNAVGTEVGALLERARRSLTFLAYREKLLSGSFRFLTYTGRDTLLATRMLLPVAGEGLVDAALESVCQRLSPEGRVAHGESLGNEAILAHLARFSALMSQNRTKDALAQLAAYWEPVLDYRAVDADFLLAPLVRDLLVGEDPELDEAARLRLLQGPKGTRISCLARNLEYVLMMAGAEDLLPYGIPLAEGVNIGNWRDSADGLGMGRYPGDVNTYLVPGALVAIGEIVNHPLAARSGLLAVADAREYASLFRVIKDPQWLDALLRRYEQVSSTYRLVRPLPHLRSAVRGFLQASNAAQRAYFEGLTVEPGCNLATFSRGHCYPADLAAGLPVTALALSARGEPIPILHSDGVMALFDNPLPVDELEAILKAFIYPYPLGLWTELGPVVANPVAAGNDGWQQTFGNDRVHGAVVWGWVVGMLELGLARQQGYLQELAGECGEACDEIQRLGELLAGLRARIPGLATSELWRWQVTGEHLAPVPFGAHFNQSTQSNPAQLWSIVWLSVYYSRQKWEKNPVTP
jgi:hypothetical protein